MGEWDRARRAYRQLIGGADPASADVGAGAVDLRPGPDTAGAGRRVLSGPDDLVELRLAVESITGPGTWPPVPAITGAERRGTVRLDRPATAVALVGAMGDLVDDRTGMWRTRKTALELVAAALADVPTLTLHAVVVG